MRRGAVHLAVQPLHARVELRSRVCGIREPVEEFLRHLAVVLVIDLVLEARPEVHRDRADLHLDGHRVRARREEHRHLDDEVQALVAVVLRLGDVVLHLQHLDVALHRQQLGEPVGVGHEAACHPHAGDVGDGLADRVERGLDSLALHLGDDAVEALQSAGDVLDGVVVVVLAELLTEDRELRDHLVHAELVTEHESLGLVAERAHLVERAAVDRLEGALGASGEQVGRILAPGGRDAVERGHSSDHTG